MDRQVHACEVLLKQKKQKTKIKKKKRRALTVCEELEVHVKFKESHLLPRPSASSPHSSSSPIDPVGNTLRLTFRVLLSPNLDMYGNANAHTHLGTMSTSGVITCPSLSGALQPKKKKKKKRHKLLNTDQADVTHGRANLTSGVHRIIQLCKHQTPDPPPYQNIPKRSGAAVDTKGRGGGESLITTLTKRETSKIRGNQPSPGG